MNLWSTLSWWSISGTLCLFPFVFICGNNECVSLHFSQSLHLYFSLSLCHLCVCYDLRPLLIFDAAGYQHKISDVVLASSSSRLSRVWEAANCPLSVSAEAREKIWYSGETKVICTRKFNCLSLASLNFSLASPSKSISYESSSDEV